MINKNKLKEFINYFHSLKISWQIYTLLAIYLLIMVITFLVNYRIALLLVLMLVILILFFTFNIKGFIRDLTNIASRMSENAALAQDYVFYNAPLGVILYDAEDRITWTNPCVQNVFGKEDLIGLKIEAVDPKLSAITRQSNINQWREISLENGYFKVLHHHEYQALYLYNITEEVEAQKKVGEWILVMGNLLIDDYDDLLYAMDDEASARFESELLSKLNRWADNYQIFLKQTEDDQFLLLLDRNALKVLENERFASIEEIKQSFDASNIPLTFSIAFAYSNQGQDSISKLAKQVKSNLDLSLGRGGDQVVVRKIDGKAKFYGGKTSVTENRSDIRSKMFYQALKGIVMTSSQVIIAGHQDPDLDSLGAALGVQRLMEALGKKAYILLNQKKLNQDIQLLLKHSYFKELMQDNFIDEPLASQLIDDNTLFILVDHHRPSISEASALLSNHEVVIIDHHRQSEEFPTNVVLSYIESSASSASELVTEYFSVVQEDESRLDPMIATTMLAGIIIDTNQFSLRTGSRTFEAAAYLKLNGADNLTIQYLLKESFETIKERNRLIEESEIINKQYAISIAEGQLLDPVLAAQTADDLLGIDHIEASFVVYQRSEDQVGISARSLGKINVQLIMEELGGGGHLSNAATQLSNITLNDARNRLIEAISLKEE